MKKILLSISLIVVILAGCSAACAQNITAEIEIYSNDGTVSSEYAALSVDEECLKITSSIIPGFCITEPINGTEMFHLVCDQMIGKFILEAPDMKRALHEWSGSFESQSQTGFFSGDAFDEAHSVIRGTCSKQDVLVLLRSSLKNQLLEAFLKDHEDSFRKIALSGISSLLDSEEIEYGIYDEGDYFSLTGKTDRMTLWTLSCNFSDPDLIMTVLGYPTEGKNHYFTSEIRYISPQTAAMSTEYRTDPDMKGYRSIINDPPVLQESWMFSASDKFSQISATGTIIPQKELEEIHISCIIQPVADHLFHADYSFGSSEKRSFSIDIKKNNTVINTDSMFVIRFPEIFAFPGNNAFIQELLEGAERIYHALQKSIPSCYIIKLNNLFR